MVCNVLVRIKKTYWGYEIINRTILRFTCSLRRSDLFFMWDMIILFKLCLPGNIKLSKYSKEDPHFSLPLLECQLKVFENEEQAPHWILHSYWMSPFPLLVSPCILHSYWISHCQLKRLFEYCIFIEYSIPIQASHWILQYWIHRIKVCSALFEVALLDFSVMAD